MRLSILISIVALGLAACETVPAAMDPVSFDAEIAQLEATRGAALADAELGAFLGRTDLSPDQRATALLVRANKRLNTKFNVPGAIEDFDAFIAARPEDARVATAERRKLFAIEEIGAAQRRLARLQNLPDWFDDKVLMGELDAAATRYQTSGLTPNAAQFYLLRESGFVCEAQDPEARDMVHQLGPEPDYVAGSVWCNGPSVS